MIESRLNNILTTRSCTLLGVGPMSKNCTDAVIELANTYEVPIMLVASRRQIEAEELGRGYVENWSTEEFAKYVIKNDKKGKVILSRDHGGPWQNDNEKNQKLSLRLAMDNAKQSYKIDINSGFQILHIDPSIDIFGKPDTDEVLERIFELYEFCWIESQDKNNPVLFEIGTEEQTGAVSSIDEIEYVLRKIKIFCDKNRIKKPSFHVIQTGTKVMEMKNVGTLNSPLKIIGEIPSEIQIQRMITICNRNNIWIKQHNTDYLSNESLKWLPKLGIHSANVAPEFGVAETKAFIEVLKELKFHKELDEFIKISNSDKKWEKWLIPDSKLTEYEKCVISGHYHFADPKVKEIKNKIQTEFPNFDLNEVLKNAIKSQILRYLQLFRLLTI